MRGIRYRHQCEAVPCCGQDVRLVRAYIYTVLEFNSSCDLQAVDTIGQGKEQDFQRTARGSDRKNRFGQHSLQ
jgi:hypothetical protein